MDNRTTLEVKQVIHIYINCTYIIVRYNTFTMQHSSSAQELLLEVKSFFPSGLLALFHHLTALCHINVKSIVQIKITDHSNGNVCTTISGNQYWIDFFFSDIYDHLQ